MKSLFLLSSRRCALLLWFRETQSAAHAEEEVTSHNNLSPWSQTHLSESLMLLVRRSAVGFGGVARWGLRCLCSGDAAGQYRDTVLLPRTDFPMKVNGPSLLEREIQIQQVQVTDSDTKAVVTDAVNTEGSDLSGSVLITSLIIMND